MSEEVLLAKKLHPDNFTAMSGRMAAIVGYVLDQIWTQPTIVELHITTDGFLLSRNKGEIGCNSFIGAASELNMNLIRLFDAAELTPEEQQAFMKLWQGKVRRWGGKKS